MSLSGRPPGTLAGRSRRPGARPARHRALLYRGPRDFTGAVGPFIRAGLAARQPVLVAVPAGRLGWIRRDLGADYQSVQVADAADFYQTLGRATRALVDWLRAQAAAGRAVRVIAEQDLAGQAGTEIAAYLRAEAAANVIYQPYAVSVLCPFDASSLPGGVLRDAQRIHPELARDGVTASSPLYTDPARFVRERSVTADPPPSAASIGFGVPGDLSAVRRFLRAELAAAGVAGEAAQVLVTAVGEVVTNALAHGRAPRRLWVYREDGKLVCHVHDGGPGPDDPLAAYLVPEPDADRGQGLWLARQVADSVELASDAAGTHVRVAARLPSQPPAGNGDHPAAAR